MTPLNDQIAQDVLENLSLNVKLSQDLLALLDNENTALRAMDTKELHKISKQKSTLIAKIQFLDDSLKNHITDDKYAPLQETPVADSSQPTFSETSSIPGLIDLLPPDRKEAAKQCKEKLSKTRHDILFKNYINKKFTQDTLGHLSDAIALFTQPVVKQNTYNAPGNRAKNRSSLPQLLSREVCQCQASERFSILQKRHCWHTRLPLQLPVTTLPTLIRPDIRARS